MKLLSTPLPLFVFYNMVVHYDRTGYEEYCRLYLIVEPFKHNYFILLVDTPR